MTAIDAPNGDAPRRDGAAGRATESFWSYASILLRRRNVVLGLPLAAGVLAGLVSLLSQREYVASATFVPQEPVSAQMGFSQLASQFGLAAPSASTSSPLFYADLLQSREVLREVLLSSYACSTGTRFHGDLLRYFRITKPDREAAVLAAMQRLRRILAVRTDQRTGVVGFSVRTTNPALSAQVARRFLDLANDYNLRRRQSQARAEREFVEQRVAAAQQSLTEAEDRLQSFYGRNRRYGDSPELVADEARLQRQVSVRQQVYLTLNQSYEAAKIEEVRNTPVITVVERPEGFVEPSPRGTVRKVFVGAFVGLFAAVVYAFAAAYLTRARASGPPDFLEFVALSRVVAGDLRRRITRRRAR